MRILRQKNMGAVSEKRCASKNGVLSVLVLTVCFTVSCALAAFAQSTGQTDWAARSQQDAAKGPVPTHALAHQPESTWESLDLLNWSADSERQREDAKLRIVSLYPQSFLVAKPVGQEATSARSYFLYLNDPGKKDALVGLANIDNEEQIERKGLYQKDLNAELLLGYEWSGFGSILFGRAIQYERFGDDVGGRTTDLGWRIKFVKPF